MDFAALTKDCGGCCRPRQTVRIDVENSLNLKSLYRHILRSPHVGVLARPSHQEKCANFGQNLDSATSPGNTKPTPAFSEASAPTKGWASPKDPG